jgi:hypothetical protein
MMADPTVADRTCTVCNYVKPTADESCAWCDMGRPEFEPESNRRESLGELVERNIVDLSIRAYAVAFYAKDAESVRKSLAAAPTDLVAALYAETMRRLEPIAWIGATVRDEIHARLVARRTERGDESKTIAIPHPEVVMEATAQWGVYQLDADELFELLPALGPDDRDALRDVLIDKQTIPGWHEQVYHEPTVIPATTKKTATAVVKRLADKLAGSPQGAILARQLKRERRPDKLVVEPARKVTP